MALAPPAACSAHAVLRLGGRTAADWAARALPCTVPSHQPPPIRCAPPALPCTLAGWWLARRSAAAASATWLRMYCTGRERVRGWRMVRYHAHGEAHEPTMPCVCQPICQAVACAERCSPPTQHTHLSMPFQSVATSSWSQSTQASSTRVQKHRAASKPCAGGGGRRQVRRCGMGGATHGCLGGTARTCVPSCRPANAQQLRAACCPLCSLPIPVN